MPCSKQDWLAGQATCVTTPCDAVFCPTVCTYQNLVSSTNFISGATCAWFANQLLNGVCMYPPRRRHLASGDGNMTSTPTGEAATAAGPARRLQAAYSAFKGADGRTVTDFACGVIVEERYDYRYEVHDAFVMLDASPITQLHQSDARYYGELGGPITDEEPITGNDLFGTAIGSKQRFEGGTIYWSPNTGAQVRAQPGVACLGE